MKEVTAIIRYEKWHPTREALYAFGVEDITHFSVKGRGRQRGLRYTKRSASGSEGGMPFLPKRVVVCAVPDDQLDALIDTIIRVNQTGNPGDGKIFVRSVVAAQPIAAQPEPALAVVR